MPEFKLFIEVLAFGSIEVPFALIEPMEIARFDAIESLQMSFGLAPKLSIQFMRFSLSAMSIECIDAHMMKFSEVEWMVHLGCIGLSNAVLSDSLFNDRRARGRFLASRLMVVKNLPAPLKQTEYGHFARCPSASFAYFGSHQKKLISTSPPPVQFVAGKLSDYEKSKPHVETNLCVCDESDC